MNKLTEVFREVFLNPDLTIERETTAFDVEGWDSMKNINLFRLQMQVLHMRKNFLV